MNLDESRNNWNRVLRTAVLFLLFLNTAAVAAPFAFIPAYAGNRVTVIDTESQRVVTEVFVGLGPYGVAVHPSGRKAYVTNYLSNDVSVIDTLRMIPVARIPVAAGPQGIAVNSSGTRAYVVGSLHNALSVIDTSTDSVVGNIPVAANPYAIVINNAGTRAYVSHGGTSVSVIDTTNNTLLTSIFLNVISYGLALSPDGTRLYVSVGESLRTIDTATNTVINNVSIGGPLYDVAVHPDGSRIYGGNRDRNMLQVFDAANGTLLNSVSAGVNAPWGVDVTPSGSHVYLVNTISRSVSVFSTTDLSAVASVLVGGSPVALGDFIGGVPAADISVYPIWEGEIPIVERDEISLVTAVRNGGPSTASSVKVELVAPAALRLLSVSASHGGSCTSAAIVVCRWTSIPEYEQRIATLRFSVPVGATGQISAQAQASAESPEDPVAENNIGVAREFVSGARLTVPALSWPGVFLMIGLFIAIGAVWRQSR